MRRVVALLSCYLALAGCHGADVGIADRSANDDDRLQLIGTGDSDRIVGTAAAERLVGLGEGDLLVGGGGADVFHGGEGPDVMSGGHGRDVYIFGGSDGADIVKDPGGGNDRLMFRDSITVNDLVFTEEAAGLRVTVGNDGNSILLIGWGQFDNYIEDFVFGDEVFKASDIEARITGPRRPKVAGTVPTQVARVGEPFEFEIPDGVFINRASGGKLKYRVTLKDGSIPDWLTFHYTNFGLFGTPGPEDVGEFPVVVTAVDENYLKASTKSAISVRPAE